MKKTIVIIILAVYISSIAIVNFFGLEVKPSDGSTVYVSNIQCDTVTLQDGTSKEITPLTYIGPKGDIPLFEFTFTPSADGSEYTADPLSILYNPNAVRLNPVVFPFNAYDQDIKYEYDEAAMEGIAVFYEDIKTLVFLKPGKIFTITLKSKDGHEKSTTIAVRGKLAQ